MTSVSATTLAWLELGFTVRVRVRVLGSGLRVRVRVRRHDARHPRLGRHEGAFAKVLTGTHPMLDDHLIRVGGRVRASSDFLGPFVP